MKVWKIISEEQFYSKIIGCSEAELQLALSDLGKKFYYGKPIFIPKKNGARKIYNINKSALLYKIQKQLANNFLNNIMVSDANYGFIKGYNYFDYLCPHVDFYKTNNYLRLDIKDFFGSIKKEILFSTLSYYCDIENDKIKNKLINYLVDILSYNGIIIQGAITSPMISNIVFREIDIRIQKYCCCFDVNYSRYVDDLFFSSSNKIILKDSFVQGISKILKDKNFNINYKKTIRSKKSISLNGYVVSDTISLSRKKISEITRILFYLENKKNLKRVMSGDVSELNNIIKIQTSVQTNKFDNKYELINYLAGNRAFLISVQKYSEDDMFLNKIKRLIDRIEKQITNLLK